MKGARLLGHPVHPMLIVFPLGLFPTALLFDIIYLATRNLMWSTMAFWMIAVAIIMALAAAAFGLVDWLGIQPRTRAKRIGALHGVGNVIVVFFFAVSWLTRRDNHAASSLAIVLEVSGVVLALVTGWLGGELVDRLGIGVDPDANPDAPSSLSHESPVQRRPATQHG